MDDCTAYTHSTKYGHGSKDLFRQHQYRLTHFERALLVYISHKLGHKKVSMTLRLMVDKFFMNMKGLDLKDFERFRSKKYDKWLKKEKAEYLDWLDVQYQLFKRDYKK